MRECTHHIDISHIPHPCHLMLMVMVPMSIHHMGRITLTHRHYQDTLYRRLTGVSSIVLIHSHHLITLLNQSRRPVVLKPCRGPALEIVFRLLNL